MKGENKHMQKYPINFTYLVWETWREMCAFPLSGYLFGTQSTNKILWWKQQQLLCCFQTVRYASRLQWKMRSCNLHILSHWPVPFANLSQLSQQTISQGSILWTLDICTVLISIWKHTFVCHWDRAVEVLLLHRPCCVIELIGDAAETIAVRFDSCR